MHSDDPVQPQFTLTMKGSLLVDVTATPRALAIRDVKVGARGSQTFELKMSETTTAKIVSVSVDDPKNFELRRVAGEAEGDSTYEVVFRGAKQVGTTSTKVRVTTNGENTPEFVIPVTARVALNLRYQKTLRFVRRNGRLQSRVLRLTAREGGAPTIKKIQDPDGLLDLEIMDSRGTVASFRATVNEAKWAAQDEQAQVAPHQLILRTTDRDEPRIEIEYQIVPESKPGPSDSAPGSAPGSVPGSATALATDEETHAQ